MDIWLPTRVSEKLEPNIAGPNDTSDWTKQNMRIIAQKLAPNRKARRQLKYRRAPLVGSTGARKHTSKRG